MKDIQQLIKKNSQEGRYEDIFPKTFIDAVEDRESGNNLNEILSGFNMYFLSYNGSREQTRLQVPMSIRKTGLWITYVLYDKTVVTEWYAGEAIDDNSWKNLSNWRVGSNMLVGDISISSDGYWVVNGVATTTKAQGEQGITPMLRVGSNNHLQVSYTNGSSWVDVSTNPVYTQFRVHDNKLEQSVDLGATWIVVSDELAYQFRNSGNKLQVSKDLGVTWEDTSDYIAAWFRFTGTTGSSQADNVGKIQISRDNGTTWTDLSGEFTNSLHIKGYVATVGALPSSAVQGDIYGVGPTYDPSDTAQTNPIYQLYVKDSTGWVNNGKFTSIAAGVVQTTGTSTTEVMSQDAVSNEFASVRSDLSENAILSGMSGQGTDILPTFYVGGITSDGNVTTESDRWHSAPVQVFKGETVIFKCREVTSMAVISLTDINGSFYTPVVLGKAWSYEYYYYVVEGDGYIAFSHSNVWNIAPTCVKIEIGTIKDVLLKIIKNKIAISENTVQITNNNSLIGNLIKSLGAKFSSSIISIPTPKSGYITGNGQIEVSSEGVYSSPIPVVAGDAIFLTAVCFGSDRTAIAITDSKSSFYNAVVPAQVESSSAVTTFSYFVEKDGYIAISYKNTYPANLMKNRLEVLLPLATSISQQGSRISLLEGSDYDYIYPSHIFAVEGGYRDSREFAVSIYPEGIQTSLSNPIPLKINGNKCAKLFLKKSSYGPYPSIYQEQKTFNISADGYKKKSFSTNYVRSSRYNAQNKKIHLLSLGASVTEDGYYLGYVRQFLDMDNEDIGNLSIKLIGNKYTRNHSYTYKDVSHSFNIYNVGRAGWCSYSFYNYPFEARADGVVGTLGAEGMYYAAGLATLTPFDSSIDGHPYSAYNGSAEHKLLAIKTPFGRFKPNLCEALWIALHNFRETFSCGIKSFWFYSTGSNYVKGASIPVYNNLTSDAIMANFFSDIVDNPDNIFYDINTARAYSGSHAWDNNCAFSINTFVDRYRTMDDNGNRLYFNSNKGTVGIAGSNNIGYLEDGTVSDVKIGYLISDVLSGDVCTPNFITSKLGYNDKVGLMKDAFNVIDGFHEAYESIVTGIIGKASSDCPNAHVGAMFPRRNGALVPDDWGDIAMVREYGYYDSNHLLETPIREYCGTLDFNKKINYIPIYFTTSPISLTFDSKIYDFDLNKDVSLMNNDNIHDGEKGPWSQSIGYQILAWIYWCCQ